MAVLRVASLVVLALWVGGLAVLGFVAAPAIFATLEAADPAAGRALAGRVFGDILRAFQPWIWALGATRSEERRVGKGCRPRRAPRCTREHTSTIYVVRG